MSSVNKTNNNMDDDKNMNSGRPHITISPPSAQRKKAKPRPKQMEIRCKAPAKVPHATFFDRTFAVTQFINLESSPRYSEQFENLIGQHVFRLVEKIKELNTPETIPLLARLLDIHVTYNKTSEKEKLQFIEMFCNANPNRPGIENIVEHRMAFANFLVEEEYIAEQIRGVLAENGRQPAKESNSECARSTNTPSTSSQINVGENRSGDYIAKRYKPANEALGEYYKDQAASEVFDNADRLLKILEQPMKTSSGTIEKALEGIDKAGTEKKLDDMRLSVMNDVVQADVSVANYLKYFKRGEQYNPLETLQHVEASSEPMNKELKIFDKAEQEKKSEETFHTVINGKERTNEAVTNCSEYFNRVLSLDENMVTYNAMNTTNKKQLRKRASSLPCDLPAKKQKKNGNDTDPNL